MPEDHEIIDAFIGDVAPYSPGGDADYFEMEADIDGDWVKLEDVKASLLRWAKANNI